MNMLKVNIPHDHVVYTHKSRLHINLEILVLALVSKISNSCLLLYIHIFKPRKRNPYKEQYSDKIVYNACRILDA